MSGIVNLEDVWVHYGNLLALEAVDLSINRNDFLAIIGPNGGGKTTLLKVILGLVKPSRGNVTVLGSSPERGRKLVGYVPQHPYFDIEFPVNVWDVVLTGRIGHVKRFHRYSDEDAKIVSEALEKVEILDLKDRHIGALSGGQRQRVFIARALATQPKLLLLDEPAISIEKRMETELYELLNRLKKNATVVVVTHDISAVSTYVEKIACLNRRLCYHGSKEISPEELMEAYKCPVQIIAHGVPHRVLKEHNEDGVAVTP